jgi:hypothetical protein
MRITADSRITRNDLFSSQPHIIVVAEKEEDT